MITSNPIDSDAIRLFLNTIPKDNFAIASVAIPIGWIDPILVFDYAHSESFALYQEDIKNNQSLVFCEKLWSFSARGLDRFKNTQEAFSNIKKNVYYFDANSILTLGYAFTFFENDSSVLDPSLIFISKWYYQAYREKAFLNFCFSIQKNTSIEDCINYINQVFKAIHNHKEKKIAIRPTIKKISPNTKADFIKNINKALEDIRSGLYLKITLARCEDYVVSDTVDIVYLIKLLKKQSIHSTIFLLKKDKDTFFFGATPESLFSIKNKRIVIDALAGSTKRNAIKKIDSMLAKNLLRDSKILHEHELVVEGVKSILKSLGFKYFRVFKTKIKTLLYIHHLYTKITGSLPNELSSFLMIEKLHPTPALGIYPKNSPLEHIAKLESFTRGLYGGGMGWIQANDDAHFFVNIRCALLSKDNLRIYAGCGITKDSQPLFELEESEIKMQSILSLFEVVSK